MKLGDGFPYTILPAFAFSKISKIKGQTEQKSCFKDVDNRANVTYKQSFVVYGKDGTVLQKEELTFNS